MERREPTSSPAEGDARPGICTGGSREWSESMKGR
jgi:hypothetical protein